jgi:hypothetical protein
MKAGAGFAIGKNRARSVCLTKRKSAEREEQADLPPDEGWSRQHLFQTNDLFLRGTNPAMSSHFSLTTRTPERCATGKNGIVRGPVFGQKKCYNKSLDSPSKVAAYGGRTDRRPYILLLELIRRIFTGWLRG